MRYALCPLHCALCAMRYALCPMPYALCAMRCALCVSFCSLRIKLLNIVGDCIVNKKEFGTLGEEAAAEYLREKGFEILERNYRILRGELDIIARDAGTLVFVEVKTAATMSYGPPETWVTPHKRRQLGRLAAAYIARTRSAADECRFDVVAVSRVRGQQRIQHIQDAFWLG